MPQAIRTVQGDGVIVTPQPYGDPGQIGARFLNEASPVEDSPPMNQTFLKKASEAPREAVHALSSSGQPTSRSAPSLCRSSKRSAGTRRRSVGCRSRGSPDIGAVNRRSVAVWRGPRSDEALRVARGSPRIWSKARTSSVSSTSTRSKTPIGYLDTSHGLGELEFVRLLLVLGEGFVCPTPITRVRWRAVLLPSARAAGGELPPLGRDPARIPSRFSFSIAVSSDYAHLNPTRRQLPRPPRGAGADGRPDGSCAGKISLAGRNILTLKKLAAKPPRIVLIDPSRR